ncbi:hypothetical protein I4U23_008152 [Adineta vaga]|nr:hypothetical protein I4U23_008152 [Adineta vaga]
MITNTNAIESIPIKKTIDLEASNHLSQEQQLDSISIEQKQLQTITDSLISIELTHNDLKSPVKSSYQIPSPTILLPGEFSSSPKSIINSNTVINKIQRSSPIESNRNLLIFNQPNSSFHRRDHIEDDKISLSSINSLNLNQPISATQISLLNPTILSQQLQTTSYDGTDVPKTSHHDILSSQHIIPTKQIAIVVPRFVDKPLLSNRLVFSPRISLSQMMNDLDEIYQSNPPSTFSPNVDLSPLKSYPDQMSRDQSQLDFTTETSSFDPSPQIKSHPEIKHQPQSSWKTKFTLKNLLSMANRDEAQALKDRKPIDYHMFLTNKFNKNSIFHYNDRVNKNLSPNIKSQLNDQDQKDNRKLYKRLLSTMGLRKPINIKKTESITSIKKIAMKRAKNTKRPTTIQYDSFQTSDEDSIEYSKNYQSEQPVLISYQAVTVSSHQD